MEFILARKGPQSRKFTRYAWDLMGANKNGWVQVQDQVVENEIQIPPSGTEEKRIAPVTQVVINQAVKKQDQVVINKVEEVAINPEEAETETEEQTSNPEEFKNLVISSLKRGTIKNFLDEKKKAYKQNDSLDKLADIVGDVLGYDVEKLKNQFGL